MLTKEQLELRKNGITGSEIAAVAGLNPWVSPFDVWCKKKGVIEDDAGSYHTERGQYLEPAIIKWYSARTGRRVEETSTIIHPRNRIIIATPDGISIGDSGDRRALEVKSPSLYTQKDWGDDGTDDIPQYYLPQVMWECAVLGTASADVAAIVNGDLRTYTVAYNERLYSALEDIAMRFWREHILTDVPPEPTGSERAREELLALYPTATEDLLPASEEMRALAFEYDRLRTEEKIVSERKSEIRNKLVQIIGHHRGVEADDFKLSYNNIKPRSAIDYDKLVADLGITPEQLNKYRVIKPAGRMLTLKIRDEQ